MTAVREPIPTTPSKAADDNAGSVLSLENERFCRLVTTHQADLWRYVRYLGAGRDEADDLVQETFLSLHRSGFDERSPQETAALVRTAGRNQLLMLRRRQKREPCQIELDAAESVWATAHPTGHTDPLLDTLRDCIAELEGKAKEIVDYHYTQQLSRQESADRIGLAVEGVKTLLRRTRAALKQCVERKAKSRE